MTHELFVRQRYLQGCNIYTNKRLTSINLFLRWSWRIGWYRMSRWNLYLSLMFANDRRSVQHKGRRSVFKTGKSNCIREIARFMVYAKNFDTVTYLASFVRWKNNYKYYYMYVTPQKCKEATKQRPVSFPLVPFRNDFRLLLHGLTCFYSVTRRSNKTTSVMATCHFNE